MQFPEVPLLTPLWLDSCAWIVPMLTVAAAASGAGATVEAACEVVGELRW